MESVDKNLLYNLGFNSDLIELLSSLLANGYKITYNTMASLGISYEVAKELRYMYELGTYKRVIDSELDLIAHLKRTFGKDKRIGIHDIPLTKVRDIPRLAVINGIKQTPWDIYNSSNYNQKDMFYKVVDIYSNRIVVETKRKPQLKYGADKKIDGLLEVKDYNRATGIIHLAIDKKYIRLCNRYMIVASLKRPEFHHGLVEILCQEGTKVYVYVQTLKAKDNIKYNNGTQRVYRYGVLSRDIQSKLIGEAESLCRHLPVVSTKMYPANKDFIIIDKEDKELEYQEQEEDILKELR